MVKIRFIKDTEKFKVGEIAQASENSAEQYISQGYAEYLDGSDEDILKRKAKEKSKKKSDISDDGFGKNIEIVVEPCKFKKHEIKVLKDGDEVEVDADNGIVRILKSNG